MIVCEVILQNGLLSWSWVKITPFTLSLTRGSIVKDSKEAGVGQEVKNGIFFHAKNDSKAKMDQCNYSQRINQRN